MLWEAFPNNDGLVGRISLNTTKQTFYSVVRTVFGIQQVVSSSPYCRSAALSPSSGYGAPHRPGHTIQKRLPHSLGFSHSSTHYALL